LKNEIVEKQVITSEDEFHPRRGHEVPEGEWNYSSILSLISVLVIPGKIPSTHCAEAEWASGLTWTGVENLSLIGI
jgi:hypothetical protein